MPKRVNNAYGLEIINGKEYYECFQCDECFRHIKDIVRHLFVDHLRPQSLTTVTNTLPTSPVVNSADTSDGANTRHSVVQSTLIYGTLDQLNDRTHRQRIGQYGQHLRVMCLPSDRQSVATKSDQMRDYANKQSKSLSATKRLITCRPPAHTSGQSSAKRPRNSQTVIAAVKCDTNAVPLADPYAPTYRSLSSPPPTTSEPDFESINTDLIVDTKRFTCLEKGCGKTFAFMQSLLQHRLKHSQRVDKTAANLITKANKILKGKNICHDWTYCPIPDYQRMGDKWFKVRKRDDRKLERHRKESFKHDHNYRGLQSLKDMKQWYRTDGVPSDPNRTFHCRYELSDGTVCPWSTKHSQQMACHLHTTHLRDRRFVCRVSGCGKEYTLPKNRRVHELNHECGFGIGNGETMTGPCGNRNINRFRRSVVVDGHQKQFQCTLCHQIARRWAALKCHLHDQHLCPSRLEWSECSPPLGAVQDSGIANNDSERSPSTLTTDAVHEFAANNDDDLQIIDENIATDDCRRRSRVSQEITEWLREKNLMPCLIGRNYTRMQALERLVRIWPYFDLRLVDGNSRYVCQYRPQECHFPATTLENISIHLSGKHFVN